MHRKRVLEKKGISPYLRGWSSRLNSSSPTTSRNDRRDGESPRVGEVEREIEQDRQSQQERRKPGKQCLKQGSKATCDSRVTQNVEENSLTPIVRKSGVFRAPFPAFDEFLQDPSIALQVRNDVKASLQNLQDQPNLLSLNFITEQTNDVDGDGKGDQAADGKSKRQSPTTSSSSSSPPSLAPTTRTTTKTIAKPSISSSSSLHVSLATDYRRGDGKTSVEKALIERTAWVRQESERPSPQVRSKLASGVLIRACQEKESDEFFICRLGRRFPTCPDFALSIIRITLLKSSCSLSNFARAQDIPLALTIRSVTRSNLVLTAMLLAARDFGLSGHIDVRELCRAAALRVKIVQVGQHPTRYTISPIKVERGHMRREHDDVGGKIMKREGVRRREGRDTKEECKTGDREGGSLQDEAPIDDAIEEKTPSEQSMTTSNDDEQKREIERRAKLGMISDREEEREEQSQTAVYSFYRHNPEQDKARERVHLVISSKPVNEALRVITMLDSTNPEIIEQELQEVASRALLLSTQRSHQRSNNFRTGTKEGDLSYRFDRPLRSVDINEKDKDKKRRRSDHANDSPRDNDDDEEEKEEDEVRGLLQQRLVCTGTVEQERRVEQRRIAKIEFTMAERNRGGVNNRLFIVNREKNRSQKIRHVLQEYYNGAKGPSHEATTRSRARRK